MDGSESDEVPAWLAYVVLFLLILFFFAVAVALLVAVSFVLWP